MCRPKGENKLITVTVDKYTLSPKRIIAGTRGSFGTETLVFDLGEDWDDMTDVALTFRAPNGEAVSVRYDGEPVAIPQEIMSHSGISEYIISGYKGTNTLLSLTGEISVLNTLDPDAAYAAEPTLTLVGELLERTKNAEGVAESVRSDADNGVFDGRGIAHITVSADRNISVEYTDGTVEDGGHFEANQRGEAAPTEETFGENGSIYTDVNGTIYYCMGCDDEGKYLWKIIYSLPVENFGDAQPMQETHFFYIPINQRSILNFGDTTPFRKEIHIPSASEAVKGDMFDFEFSMDGGLFHVRIENGNNCYPYPCTLHPSFKYRFHGDFDGNLWTVKVDEFPLYECSAAEKVCVALGYVPADKEALDAVTEEVSKIDNTVSNALKGNASGEAVVIDDCSPVEHEMSIKVNNKNLVDFTKAVYRNSDYSVTITDNGVVMPAGANYYIKIPCDIKAGTTVTPSYEGENSAKEKVGTYSFQLAGGGYSNKRNSGMSTTLSDDATFFLIYKNAESTNLTSDLKIKNIQVELGSKATNYTPYKDVDKVKVSKYGKNLVTSEFGVYIPCLIPEEAPFVVSSNNTVSDGISLFLYNESKEDIGIVSLDQTSGDRVYGNMVAPEQVYYVMWEGLNTTTVVNGQLELGTSATAYEPYKEPIIYSLDKDGVAEGITSVYPNATLLTDTAGAVIDVTYNRDLNKAFAELYNAIISIGGNI